ncbi:site-specific integrase [Clostridium cadaveris]|uniref:site-specific integrase n=1 Tax=Clostridium cadaveris TaxID=1529 RepID=UPI0015B5AF67|nr:site-specific integrase [Clostridium cadaveris]NWK11332.1 site-specific integrase [Clostridium cadaveris]
MNTVEPIRDWDLLLDIEDYLKDKNERDYVWFMSGIFLGRRISDILPLKVRDVKNKDFIYIREKKTGKEARLPINEELKEIYREYCKGKKDYEYLFRSRGKNKPITRQRVWQILNDVAREFEYKDKIGCHTLRKTFGYWLYQDTKDAVAIQDMLNQSDISITKRYIGVTQDTNDSIMKGMSFRKRR